MPGADNVAEQIRQMKTLDRASRTVLFRALFSSCLFGLFAAWSGIFVPYSVGASAQDQTVSSTHSSELSMRQHFDAAYRFQSSGDLSQARLQYELFLADALHEVGNGRANIREYARGLPLYEEALELAPADFALNLDYAAAALEADDPSKAKLLLERSLNLYAKSAKGSEVASAHLILGRALQKTNGYSEAVEQFKQAVALDPSFVNSYALGAGYLTLPDKEDAARTFAEIMSRFGDTAAMRMNLGRAYGELGYPDEAIQEFKKAIAKDDKLPGAHYSLGASYINKSEEAGFALAEPEFRKEVALQPNDPLSYSQLGRIALSQHKLQEAEMDLELATALNPRNPDNFFLLGQVYTEMHKPLDAEKALRKAIAETPDPSRNHYDIQHAHYRLGRLLVESGQTEEGKKELQVAQELLMRSRLEDETKMAGKPVIEAVLSATPTAKPKEVTAEKAFEKQIGPLMAGCYNNLGGIAAIAGDYARAAHNFERAWYWNPSLKGIDGNWGRTAFAAQQYGQALGPLDRALHAHPEDAELRSMLGISQYETGSYAKAVKTLQPMAASLRKVPPRAFAYAQSMVKIGDFQNGLEWLRALVQADPGNVIFRRALGEGYASSGNYPKAEAELRTAITLDPVNTEAKDALALSLIALGQRVEAETLLAGLVAGGSQNAETYFRLGQLQLERGDAKSAVGSLETAAKMTPENKEIHENLVEAYRRNAQPEEAEREKALLETLQAQHAPVSFPDANTHGAHSSTEPH
jgi:tetratricopeptide (TPR) repeat protein